MAADTLAEGAEEIDLVLPWRLLVDRQRGADARDAPHRSGGRSATRRSRPSSRRANSATPDLIRRAATIAVEEGADFLKTSTGKVPVNATPEAVEILLEVAREADRPIGVKASGGIRTADDAAAYLALCDRIMGDGLGAAGDLPARRVEPP
jgi:deoxyribose-phosphate aldolase